CRLLLGLFGPPFTPLDCRVLSREEHLAHLARLLARFDYMIVSRLPKPSHVSLPLRAYRKIQEPSPPSRFCRYKPPPHRRTLASSNFASCAHRMGLTSSCPRPWVSALVRPPQSVSIRADLLLFFATMPAHHGVL